MYLGVKKSMYVVYTAEVGGSGNRAFQGCVMTTCSLSGIRSKTVIDWVSYSYFSVVMLSFVCTRVSSRLSSVIAHHLRRDPGIIPTVRI